MRNQIFYLALIFSLLIHFSILQLLSLEKLKKNNKPAKQIEVTYTNVKPKVVKENKIFEDLNFTKDSKADKDIELLEKDFDAHSPVYDKIRDVSKMPNHVPLGRKETSKIKTLDINRKITIPLLKAEKITNPRYLSYNQTIRQMIRQRAYGYIDHPDFEVGEVYLTFVLGSNGLLKELKVIDQKTSANEYLKSVGLKSVREAAPFPVFPKELRYPELTFNVVISFEIQN